MSAEGRNEGPRVSPLTDADLLGDPRALGKFLTVSSGLVYIYDLVAQRFVYANRGMIECLGGPAGASEAFSSGFLASLLHPEDVEKMLRHQARFASAGDEEVCCLEYRIHGSNGPDRWLRSRDVVLVRGEDGVPVRILGTAEDLTLQKLGEESLRESEERFRLAMQATSDGIWDWNVASDEVYYSPPYTQMLGYEPDEFAARLASWADLIHPEDRTKILAANEACIRGASPSFEMEYRMQARDGAIKWILGRGKAIARDPQGVALRMVGTHVDITERKQAEEDLKASEARYRMLFNNAQVGMFRTRLDGSEMLELNDKYLQIIGRTREEVANQPSTLVWADPKAREEMVGRLLADGFVTDFEMSVRHANGKALECVTSIKLFRDEGILEGSLQDISGRKRAEEEKARLQAQLLQTQKMESLGTLSGGIAHDMNNVLGAILGLA